MAPADRAQIEQEAALQSALRHRRPAGAPPAPTGLCLNCDETPPPGERFCDEFCRDDYVRLQLKQANDQIVEGARPWGR